MLRCNLRKYEIGRDDYREKLLRCLERVLEHLDCMQCDLAPMVHFWDGDLLKTEKGDFMHNKLLGVYERLRKVSLDAEGAGPLVLTRLGSLGPLVLASFNSISIGLYTDYELYFICALPLL